MLMRWISIEPGSRDKQVATTYVEVDSRFPRSFWCRILRLHQSLRALAFDSYLPGNLLKAPRVQDL